MKYIIVFLYQINSCTQTMPIFLSLLAYSSIPVSGIDLQDQVTAFSLVFLSRIYIAQFATQGKLLLWGAKVGAWSTVESVDPCSVLNI